ncbi:DUF3010 family protein [Desulfovibrio desulfuricans]|uniref:DUF3010 family protein n=1 Tax=Desulfovibrio desulfuricans TaxID=876 RepID=UPI001F2A1D5C|nr:DUF3010 family protein [Desulfovibrio desulfuricans]UIA99425.1 DUF3010 family protein [Desulfovibrio desulfuricans]
MKKILAVKPGTDDITLSVVEGSQDQPKLKKLDIEVYKANTQEDVTKNLYDTQNYIKDIIKKEKIDEVHIVKAVKPQKGSVSPERVKNEAAVQLAASSLNVNAKLIAPQSIRAAEKKEEDVEKIFDCKFKSKDKKEVAFLGYMGLKD